MNIFVNGTRHEVPPGTTVASLLSRLEMTAKHLAVEVNLQLVPRTAHAGHTLAEADRLEIVTLVGGG